MAKDRQIEDKAMYESRTWAAGRQVAMEGDAIYCSDSPATHEDLGQVDMEVLGLQMINGDINSLATTVTWASA